MARFKSTVAAAALYGAAAMVGASPCTSGALSSYLGSPGLACEVGALSFSAFVVEAFPGATAQLPPEGVQLTPGASGFALDVSPLSASAGALFGLRFGFHVDGAALGGGTITLGAAAVATGDGVITALLDAGAAGSAIAIVADGVGPEPGAFTTAPTSFFDVFVEIGVDAGPSGEAAIGPRLAAFGFGAAPPIPEPATLGLMLLGLGALALRLKGPATPVA